MRPSRVSLLLIASLAWNPTTPQSAATPRSLGLFDQMVRLPEADWRELRAGGTIVRTLPVERDDHHLALVMAGRTTVTADQFIAGVRHSARLWRGARVPRSGTFGHPSSLDDVAGMVLSADNLRAVRSCRPADCDIKLSSSEMTRLQQRLHAAGELWQQAAHQEFRAIVLNRIEAYRRGGLSGLPAPHDQEVPTDLQAVFAGLLASTPALARHAPAIARYVEQYPSAPLPPRAHEVQYWLETSETPKPTIQAVHAVIQRQTDGGPIEVLVVSRQIFATHYVNGSLSISGLLRDPVDPAQRYLVYVNRSAIDGLAGFLSGLRRYIIERRIRGAARGAFEHLRAALERGV